MRLFLNILCLFTFAHISTINGDAQFVDLTKSEYEILIDPEEFDDLFTFYEEHKRFDADINIDDSAMYNHGRFEGDIVNPGLEADTVERFMEEGGIVAKNGIRSAYRVWPNARVPFTISSQFTAQGVALIKGAMRQFSTRTCIRFVPKASNDRDYVFILPGNDGCYSMIGRQGGKQDISIGSGCLKTGIVMHEFMHAVGFLHEQSRSDRDDHVSIVWSNIMSGNEDQFQKYSQRAITHLGTNYDYDSLMHYSKTAFSKNGLPTIQPKNSRTNVGQRRGLSDNDVYKINKLYKCPSSGTSTGTATPAPSINTKGSSVCQMESIQYVIQKVQPMFPSDPTAQIQAIRYVQAQVEGGSWGVIMFENPSTATHALYWKVPTLTEQGTTAYCQYTYNSWLYIVFKANQNSEKTLDAGGQCPMNDIEFAITQVKENAPSAPLKQQVPALRDLMENVYGGKWGVLGVNDPSAVGNGVNWIMPNFANAYCSFNDGTSFYSVFKTSD